MTKSYIFIQISYSTFAIDSLDLIWVLYMFHSTRLFINNGVRSTLLQGRTSEQKQNPMTFHASLLLALTPCDPRLPYRHPVLPLACCALSALRICTWFCACAIANHVSLALRTRPCFLRLVGGGRCVRWVQSQPSGSCRVPQSSAAPAKAESDCGGRQRSTHLHAELRAKRI